MADLVAEFSRSDPFHCILKHLSSAKVHFQEVHTSAIEEGHSDIARELREIIDGINVLIRAVSVLRSGSDVDFAEFYSATTQLRRRGMVVFNAISAKYSSLSRRLAAADEITWGIGNLVCVEEHLVDVRDPTGGGPGGGGEQEQG